MNIRPWFKARLHRRMILSQVVTLLLFLVAILLFFRFTYGAHIKQLFGERFARQTALRFVHLRERLQPLLSSSKPQAKPSGRGRPGASVRDKRGGAPPASKPALRDQDDALLVPIMPTLRTYVRESALLLGAAVTLRVGKRCLMKAAPVQPCKRLPWICRLPPETLKNKGNQRKTSSMARQNVRLVEPTNGSCVMLPSRKRHARLTSLWTNAYSLDLPNQRKLTLTFQWLYPLPNRHMPWLFLVYLLLLFFLVASLSMPMSRQITRPLQELTETVEEIQRGNLNTPLTTQSCGEVGELARSVEHMRQALLRMNKQRTELVADLSHEIRTPLSRIRNVAECVGEGLMRDNLEQTMQGVCHQVDEVNHLIGGLLEVARFDLPQKPSLEKSLLHPETLLEEVHRHFLPNARTEGKQLLLSLPEEPLPSLSADHHKLQQVFANLLENAIRYTPNSGTITLSARAVEEGIQFEVSDQGPGIPEEFREKVFERLVRIDPSRARQTGGQGLGLAIVKQIVEAHGGAVGVNPGEKGGADFWFVLPSRDAEPK